MNSKITLFLALLMLAGAFASCKKDEDPVDTTPNNSFFYDGQEYELIRGFEERIGENTGLGTYDIDIIFTSAAIDYNENTQEYVGKGNYIYLDLNSSAENELKDGTYTFSDTRNSFALSDAEYGLDYDVENETGTIEEAIGGSVVVKTVDGVQQLEYDLTLSGNRKVTGFFNGERQIVD